MHVLIAAAAVALSTPIAAQEQAGTSATDAQPGPEAAYVDTDLSAAENRAFVDPTRNITDSAIVFSLTASF